MRLAFLLGWKDCLVRFQSRSVLIAVIVLPLAMTVVTGFAFKGLEPGSIKARVALVVQDKNLSPEVSAVLAELDSLQADSGAKDQPDREGSRAPAGAQLEIVKNLSADEASRQVADEDLHAAIVVPQGFSRAFAAGDALDIALITHANQTLARSVAEVAFDRLVEVLKQRQKRVVTVKRSAVGEVQRLVGFDSFSQAVAGNGVMFILMNCITTGGIALVRERRQNTLARLMISPMSAKAIILGKTIGVFMVGVVQAIIVFGFGAIFFGVLRGVDVLGVVLITLLLILVGCALGLTISALARREETVEALGSPLALVMTALGGGMFPVEMGPEWLQRVSLFLPTGWAMKGYHDLIWYGKSAADVLPNLGVLAGFAAVFLFVGIWSLRWE